MLVKCAGPFPMKGPNEPDYDWVSTDKNNYQIPLEIIARYYIAGSMYDRVQRGVVKPEELGFPSGYDPKKIKKGEKLPKPKIEVTTKFEKFDRPVSIDEAFRIAGMKPEEYEEMVEIVLRIDEEIAKEVEPRGLIHVDGKKEFAFGHNRELVLIDTFGTGDEDRFWLKKPFEEEGKMIELSKEYVRQYYRRIGYYSRLEKTREVNKQRKLRGNKLLPEPEIPPLPEEEIIQVSKLYKQLTAMIIGKT